MKKSHWLLMLLCCLIPLAGIAAIVLFRVPDAPGFLRETRARSVLVNPIDATSFRAVTHLDVGRDDVEEALGRIEEGLRTLRG